MRRHASRSICLVHAYVCVQDSPVFTDIQACNDSLQAVTVFRQNTLQYRAMQSNWSERKRDFTDLHAQNGPTTTDYAIVSIAIRPRQTDRRTANTHDFVTSISSSSTAENKINKPCHAAIDRKDENVTSCTCHRVFKVWSHFHASDYRLE